MNNNQIMETVDNIKQEMVLAEIIAKRDMLILQMNIQINNLNKQLEEKNSVVQKVK